MLRRLKIVYSLESFDRLRTLRRRILSEVEVFIVYRIILSVMAGVILALAFSSFNLGILAWVGLIPFFFALDKISTKQALIISYICGFVFFISSMYWLVFVTPVGWLLLSLYQALYFGVFGLLVNFFLSSIVYRLSTYFYIPSLWVLLEYLRSHICGGIGWNLLGYSQYKDLPIIQIADITGVYGVSFLIILVNLTVFFGIKMAIGCQKANRRFFAKSTAPFIQEVKSHPFVQSVFVFFIIIFALGYGYGKIGSLTRDSDPAKDKLKVSVIQGNIPQLQKWDESYRGYILKRYGALTAEAAKESPALIIWPETSVPGYLNDDNTLLKQVRDIVKKSNAFLLAGAPMAAGKTTRLPADYNSAVLFSPTAEILQQYNKLYLVAFGEFVPLERYLPFLRNILPLTGEFIPGNSYTIFDLSTLDHRLSTKFGVLICFEDIFPDLVRHFVKNGADFMVNITNDAWFGNSCAAYQHAANSVFRAVENRRPFARSANTGLSCFIDPIGRIYSSVRLGRKELFIAGYATDIVVFKPVAPSFYTRVGDIFTLFCALMVGVFIIDYLRRQRYNK